MKPPKIKGQFPYSKAKRRGIALITSTKSKVTSLAVHVMCIYRREENDDNNNVINTNNNNNNNNNDDDNNNNNSPRPGNYWVDVRRGIVSSHGERDPLYPSLAILLEMVSR